MSTFRSTCIRREASFELALARPAAFELFTAEGERRWAPGWEPRILRPRDGATEAGSVFLTRAQERETIWWVERLDRAAGLARYLRITPHLHLAVVEVRLAASAGTETAVRVAYDYTSLSAEGNRVLAELTPEAFADFIASWKTEIEQALAREANGIEPS